MTVDSPELRVPPSHQGGPAHNTYPLCIEPVLIKCGYFQSKRNWVNTWWYTYQYSALRSQPCQIWSVQISIIPRDIIETLKYYSSFFIWIVWERKNTPRSSAKIKTMLGCRSLDWPWEQRARERLNRKTKKEYAGPSPKQAKEFVVLDMSKMGRENVWLSWKSKNVKSWSLTLQTSFLGWPCFNCAVS